MMTERGERRDDSFGSVHTLQIIKKGLRTVRCVYDLTDTVTCTESGLPCGGVGAWSTPLKRHRTFERLWPRL